MRLHARLTPILTLLSTKKVALTLRKTNKQTNKKHVPLLLLLQLKQSVGLLSSLAQQPTPPEVWPTDLLI